jgi:hypothetical protein
MIHTLSGNSNSDVLRPVLKRLNAARPVYADYFDSETMQQRRIRLVKLTRHEHGEVTMQGINGERVRLHLSRVSFAYS